MCKAWALRMSSNSRSTDFSDQILALTDGQGVDVVLNSLTGPFIPASLRTLAQGGFFLELGKREILTSAAMTAQRPDVRYVVYDLAQEIKADPAITHRLLRPILDDIGAGKLRPLPVTVFPLEHVGKAMRFMAQARHVGKVVLRNSLTSSEPTPVRISDSGTYWITGGLGALGREAARWLVSRGARHLVLSGRRGQTDADLDLVHELQQAAVNCRIVAADVGDSKQMAAAFAEMRRTMPPLRGVIHAAGVLRDGALINQRREDGVEVRRGKVNGAWILHELTRDLPLDFFVLYSAAAALIGGAGQAWYVTANAELDALAHYRHRIGLPAVSVAWGPWAGSGMAAALSNRDPDAWKSRGLGTITPSMAFAELEHLLGEQIPYGAIFPIDWGRFLSQLPRGTDRSFFSDIQTTSQPIVVPSTNDTDLPKRLKAVPAAQRRQALIADLTGLVRNVVGLDPKVQIDSTIPLREKGLDSLMAVELRNLLVQVGGRSLPATLLFDYPELDRLSSYLYHAWGLDFDAERENEIRVISSPTEREVADLSDAEAELLLSRELEQTDIRK